MGYVAKSIDPSMILAALTTDSIKWKGDDLKIHTALTLERLIYPEIELSTIPPLTVAIFQAAAFTEGTITGREKMNDGLTVSSFAANLNEYAIIDLGAVYTITQYNHYGQADMNADGEWTIDYLTRAGWQNWATFPTRVYTWTGWQALTLAAVRWLRVKSTTTDSFGTSNFVELEIKH